jgi:hypothetical protein
MNPVLQTPFTYKELRQMQEKAGCITATISWPWNETGDIDNLNDTASELITGDCCALEDISYKLAGADVEKQEVLIEVTGTVENWLEEQEDESH